MPYPLPQPQGPPPQTHNGSPVAQFGPPILRHVGRWVESDEVSNAKRDPRVWRARQVKFFSAQNRLAFQDGNAVFVARLDQITAMLQRGLVNRQNGATVRPDGQLYPEDAASGWTFSSPDAGEVAGQGGFFDLDSRGYIYAGYPTMGWGVAQDDGRTTGRQFPFIAQVEPGAVAPQSVVALNVGSKFYALVADNVRGCIVYDVTNPASPREVTSRVSDSDAIRRYDRQGERVAWVDGKNQIRIAMSSDLVSTGKLSGSLPSTQSGGFIDVAFDEAGNVWAVEGSILWRVAPGGAATSFPVFAGLRGIRALAVGAGYIAVVGIDRVTGRYDVQLARIEASGPVLVQTGSFFRDYYFGGAGFSRPGQYTLPMDLGLTSQGGKTYIFCAFEGLGDVYELAPAGVVVPPVTPPPVVPPPVVPPVVPPVLPPVSPPAGKPTFTVTAIGTTVTLTTTDPLTGLKVGGKYRLQEVQ